MWHMEIICVPYKTFLTFQLSQKRRRPTSRRLPTSWGGTGSLTELRTRWSPSKTRRSWRSGSTPLPPWRRIQTRWRDRIRGRIDRSYRQKRNRDRGWSVLKPHSPTWSYLLPLYRKFPQSLLVVPHDPLFLMLVESWVNEIAHLSVTSLCGLIPSGPVVLTVFKWLNNFVSVSETKSWI